MAHTGGKSLAASCDAQTWTRSGGDAWLINPQAQQLVEAAVEARLRGDASNRQQHARHVRLAARRAMRDRQGLPWEPEDDLLVGDESRQPHAVHRDAALLASSGAGERLLL